MGCTALAGEPRLYPRLPKPKKEVAFELQLGSKPLNLLWSAQLTLAESTGYKSINLKQVPCGQCPTSQGITMARAEEEPGGAWTFSPFLMPL